MIRLYTLGATNLLADDGQTLGRLLSQPKSVALLSYLALGHRGTFQRRGNLLALFWPEHDEKHARWALNQALRRLRSQLGESSIVSRGPDEIAVTPDVVWCDAVAFEEACAREDCHEAVQLYRGQFLDGLQVAGCVELAQWLDSQRARLRRLAGHATWVLVDRLQAHGALREAVDCARNGVGLVPEDEPGVRRLIALLDATGDRAGAVQVYEECADWLSENLGVEPAPETVAAIDAVKARASVGTARSQLVSDPVRPVRGSQGQTAHHGTDPGHATRSWAGIGAATLGVLMLLTTGLLWMRRERDSASSNVTPSIHRTLTSEGQRTPVSSGVVNPEAYQAYLLGRHQLRKGTMGAFQTAADHFRRALDLDPAYAPAYAALADVYNRIGIQGRRRPGDVYPLVKAALAEAIKLGETSGEALVLQGVVKFRYDRDWQGAERDLKKVLDIEPNSARAHLAYGMYLLAVGRLEEGLAHSVKYQELDPLSAFASGNLAVHLYYSKRYDESISLLRRALDLDPASGAVYAFLGLNHAAKGAYGPAVAACDSALALTPDDDAVISECGAAYAASGRRMKAMHLFEGLRQRLSVGGYVDPYRLALLASSIHRRPGEADHILQLLNRAYEERTPTLCMVKVEPAFRRFIRDPRFQELLRRMDFPE